MTRHRFDAFSFLVGAVAVAVAAVVLSGGVDVRLVDLRVIGPVVVLAIGAALLVGGKRDDRPVVVPSGPADADGREAGAHLDAAWHEDGWADPEEVEPERTATQRIEPEDADTRRIEPEDTDTRRIEPEDADTRRIEPEDADTRRIEPEDTGTGGIGGDGREG